MLGLLIIAIVFFTILFISMWEDIKRNKIYILLCLILSILVSIALSGFFIMIGCACVEETVTTYYTPVEIRGINITDNDMCVIVVDGEFIVVDIDNIVVSKIMTEPKVQHITGAAPEWTKYFTFGLITTEEYNYVVPIG